MGGGLIAVIVAVPTALIGVATVLVAMRRNHNDLSSSLMASIQKERDHLYAALSDERTLRASETADLHARIQALEATAAPAREHIAHLEAHIWAGKPPPPPPPPAGYIP